MAILEAEEGAQGAKEGGEGVLGNGRPELAMGGGDAVKEVGAETVCCLLCNASVLCFNEVIVVSSCMKSAINVILSGRGGEAEKAHESGTRSSVQHAIYDCRVQVTRLNCISM